MCPSLPKCTSQELQILLPQISGLGNYQEKSAGGEPRVLLARRTIFASLRRNICWLVDGLSDEGYGDAFVYSKVGAKKFGAVESSLADDFRRLLVDDFEWIGMGEHAIRFVRHQYGFFCEDST